MESILTYGTDETADEWQTILRTVDDEARHFVAERMNASKFDFSRWMSGSVRPDTRHRLTVAWYLEDHARATLTALGLVVPDHRANLFAAYAEQVAPPAVELKERVIEWIHGLGQRRVSTILGVPRTNLREKIAGHRDWTPSEVLDWARRARLLPVLDASEDSEAIDAGSEPPTETLDAESWTSAPRMRVRDEPTWLGDAVEESNDGLDDDSGDDLTDDDSDATDE
jgi:hypothetical protein